MLQRSSVCKFYFKNRPRKATLCKTLNDSEVIKHGEQKLSFLLMGAAQIAFRVTQFTKFLLFDQLLGSRGFFAATVGTVVVAVKPVRLPNLLGGQRFVAGQFIGMALWLAHVVVTRYLPSHIDGIDFVQCGIDWWLDLSLSCFHGFGALIGGVLHESAMGHFLGGTEFFQSAADVFCPNQRLLTHGRTLQLATTATKLHVHHGAGNHPSDSGVCV
jgi:hypothetical protein